MPIPTIKSILVSYIAGAGVEVGIVKYINTTFAPITNAMQPSLNITADKHEIAVGGKVCFHRLSLITKLLQQILQMHKLPYLHSPTDMFPTGDSCSYPFVTGRNFCGPGSYH